MLNPQEQAATDYVVTVRPHLAEMAFTISARRKNPGLPIMRFLADNYGSIPIKHIDSLFGFVEPCTLYGGRMYLAPELFPSDVAAMYDNGIGLRIPLTNHYVDEAEYEASRDFLEKYHRPGNATIVTNDNLARWIGRDYPDYRIEASVIKNINSHAKINAALEIYETVILPMSCCERTDFLEAIEQKDRVTLFANAGCALTCPAHICYIQFSKFNKCTNDDERRVFEFDERCSRTIKERDARGMVDFDLEALTKLGFHRFKLLRARAGSKTGI
jgi:hypothetical protein